MGDAARGEFVRRKALESLAPTGKWGCSTPWAKRNSTGFGGWQVLDSVCVSPDGTMLMYKPEKGVALDKVTLVDVDDQPVLTCSELGLRQYQMIVHAEGRDPLVLNCADRRCFDAWTFSLRVLVPGLTEYSTEPLSPQLRAHSAMEKASPAAAEVVAQTDDALYLTFEVETAENCTEPRRERGVVYKCCSQEPPCGSRASTKYCGLWFCDVHAPDKETALSPPAYKEEEDPAPGQFYSKVNTKVNRG